MTTTVVVNHDTIPPSVPSLGEEKSSCGNNVGPILDDAGGACWLLPSGQPFFPLFEVSLLTKLDPTELVFSQCKLVQDLLDLMRTLCCEAARIDNCLPSCGAGQLEVWHPETNRFNLSHSVKLSHTRAPRPSADRR